MTTEHKEKPTTLLLQSAFEDVKHLGKVAGFDLGFRMLEPGSPAIPATVLASANMSVVKMRFHAGYHQRGLPPRGFLTLGIPVRGLSDWFGASYRDLSILPFNQSSGIDGVSRAGFSAYTVSIREEFVDQVAKTFQLPVADVLCAPASGAFVQDSQGVRALRECVGSLYRRSEPVLDKEQEIEVVVRILQSAMGESDSTGMPNANARMRALSKALEYIEEHPGENVSVSELCAATRTPWRTLGRAFQERFGVSPKTYLQRARLSAVRSRLVLGGGSQRIADVANEFDFWHLGQFARDYQAAFGELPSATVRRSTNT